jgi:uncharacterized BrkB/YihY/UPF0761 family membrane protein
MSKLDKTLAGSLIAFVVTTITWMTYFYVQGLNPLESYGGTLGYIMGIDFWVSVGSAIVGIITIFAKFIKQSNW